MSGFASLGGHSMAIVIGAALVTQLVIGGPAGVPTSERPSANAVALDMANGSGEVEINEPEGDKDAYRTNDDALAYADQGMVGLGEYVSPQYDAHVQWSPHWVLDADQGDAVMSDPEAGVDAVWLNRDEDPATGIAIYIIDSYYAPMGAIVNYLVDLDEPDDDIDIVLAGATGTKGAVVLLRDYGSETPALIYDEIRYGPGGASFVVIEILTMDPDITEPAILAAQAGVVVDGEQVLTFYDAGTIAQTHRTGEPPAAYLDSGQLPANQLRSSMHATMRRPRMCFLASGVKGAGNCGSYSPPRGAAGHPGIGMGVSGHPQRPYLPS